MHQSREVTSYQEIESYKRASTWLAYFCGTLPPTKTSHSHLLPFTQKTRTKRLFYVNKIFAKFSRFFFLRVILYIFEEEPHIAAKIKNQKRKRKYGNT